ncbi:glycine/D-amino acid oxidase-like deaminating enzyme [Aminobacter aminovorans]|jgi:glycine/D-amino acid oxidase-like deaminating enzyme|uniref:Glycine/D-amino acid oxidase-like deaminating enzyme n=1 Tax=Aminobacter aminovorans TaxID=83263 RepID=A0ABR6H324_AMIAI|nr:glycine/D-amino acid oxidase-like deaminating enzyme [Aminobacter aminovorans]
MIIIGGGGHVLAMVYSLANGYEIRNVAVIEKGFEMSM